VHTAGQHRHGRMEPQRPPASRRRVDVHPLRIDDEVINMGGRIEECAGRSGLVRQGQVKRPLIHDVGDRLLRGVRQLGPIPRDRLHPAEDSHDGFRGEGKFLESIETDDAGTEHFISRRVVFLEQEGFESA
jgi:hypothetical protein